jgi:hypothetical protein
MLNSSPILKRIGHTHTAVHVVPFSSIHIKVTWAQLEAIMATAAEIQGLTRCSLAIIDLVNGVSR